MSSFSKIFVQFFCNTYQLPAIINQNPENISIVQNIINKMSVTNDEFYQFLNTLQPPNITNDTKPVLIEQLSKFIHIFDGSLSAYLSQNPTFPYKSECLTAIMNGNLFESDQEEILDNIQINVFLTANQLNDLNFYFNGWLNNLQKVPKWQDSYDFSGSDIVSYNIILNELNILRDQIQYLVKTKNYNSFKAKLLTKNKEFIKDVKLCIYAPCIQKIPRIHKIHKNYVGYIIEIIGLRTYDSSYSTYGILLTGNAISDKYNVNHYITINDIDYLIGD